MFNFHVAVSAEDTVNLLTVLNGQQYQIELNWQKIPFAHFGTRNFFKKMILVVKSMNPKIVHTHMCTIKEEVQQW